MVEVEVEVESGGRSPESPEGIGEWIADAMIRDMGGEGTLAMVPRRVLSFRMMVT
jgi:hypothetical protein